MKHDSMTVDGTTGSLKAPTPHGDKAIYPFSSKFVEILGHKIHYVEYGDGDPILFVHGNPTSSYLWRNVLPHVADQTGQRGIAIDLLGFGKSDKPDDIPYTLDLHGKIISGFVDVLGLKNITLVADDWGGPLGMHDLVNRPELYRSAVLLETFLWTFTFVEDFEPKFRLPFRMMRGPLGFIAVQVFNMMTKKFIPEHCPITDEGMQFYLDAMPTIKSRRAMRAFVKLNPLHGKPGASVQFIENIRAQLPKLDVPISWLKATPGVIPSDDYPPSKVKWQEIIDMIPHITVKDFGPGHHFLAEENPQRLVELIVESLSSNSAMSVDQGTV